MPTKKLDVDIMPALLTPKELALKLKVSLKAIVNWTQAGLIPGQIKIGRIWRYKSQIIDKRILTKGQFLLKE